MNKKHKYRVIVKTADRFVKYRTSNLLNFAGWLDSNWPSWRYFNVYDRATSQQIASYTINRRPQTKHVTAPCTFHQKNNNKTSLPARKTNDFQKQENNTYNKQLTIRKHKKTTIKTTSNQNSKDTLNTCFRDF